MHLSKAISLLAAVGVTVAQRPSDTPVCDYYTKALLKENTAKNQYTLLQLVVNTVVIGNYTQPNVGIAVPGILAKGTYNGVEVDLAPYFNGMLASSNRGGDSGVSVNFLDGGGAAPLMNNTAANDMNSNQYKLLTHLYQFFGYLLGCTMYGQGDFPAYAGDASMADVHRFMDLDNNEFGYFVQQVGLAAESFGVAADDAKTVGMALTKLFGYRCSPAETVIPAQGPVLDSICIADNCPISPNATCDAYPAASSPSSAMSSGGSMPTGGMNGTMTMSGTPTMTGSMSGSMTGTMPAMQTTNAASHFAAEGMVAAVGVAALAFAL